jgi:hypothetical protein
MPVSGFRFDTRDGCPFMFDQYGKKCNAKIIMNAYKDAKAYEGGDTTCGILGHDDNEIPIDCPLHNGCVTVGLIYRKHEDTKELISKTFQTLEAYMNDVIGRLIEEEERGDNKRLDIQKLIDAGYSHQEIEGMIEDVIREEIEKNIPIREEEEEAIKGLEIKDLIDKEDVGKDMILIPYDANFDVDDIVQVGGYLYKVVRREHNDWLLGKQTEEEAKRVINKIYRGEG